MKLERSLELCKMLDGGLGAGTSLPCPELQAPWTRVAVY